jgi:hypothetical protein
MSFYKILTLYSTNKKKDEVIEQDPLFIKLQIYKIKLLPIVTLSNIIFESGNKTGFSISSDVKASKYSSGASS